MNAKDLLRLGVPLGEPTRRATDFISKFILNGGDKTRLREELSAVLANPANFLADPLRGEFAKSLQNAPPPPRAEPVHYRQWGEGLEADAVRQMANACLLPVAVAGALMPDAHVGYGLPIGGVLATDNAVIPYAVGVDIACRMKLTVLDLPVRDLGAPTRLGSPTPSRRNPLRHRRQLQGTPRARRDGRGLDRSARSRNQHKDKAWAQLGTSGSGNHFVEFGAFTARQRRSGPRARRIPRAAQPQRQPRHRRAGLRPLQQTRHGPAPGPAARNSSTSHGSTSTPRTARNTGPP